MIEDSFIPPFNSGDSTYIDALSQKLRSYVEYVKTQIAADVYVIRKIKHLNESILAAISDIKQANSQQAYSCISKFITDEKDNIELPVYTLNNKTPLFRLRYSESDLTYRRDIFHIPNSLRHIISQQRYSITGVPCLYLSGCAFTAWLELNKPNFSNLWCSGFRAEEEFDVLDMAIRLDSIVRTENNYGKLIFYPLIIATSFTTKYPKSPFKEEYIISNILLQAIINNTDLKGVRYFSTKISNYKPEYGGMASNIVLPAISLNSEYDRVLAKSLILTYPQPCSVLMHSINAGDVVAFGCDPTDRSNFKDGISHFESMIYEWYGATQFYNIDGHISRDLSYDHIEMFSS